MKENSVIDEIVERCIESTKMCSTQDGFVTEEEVMDYIVAEGAPKQREKRLIPGDLIYLIRKTNGSKKGVIIAFVDPSNNEFLIGYMLCRTGERKFKGQWAIEQAKVRGTRLGSGATERALAETIPFTIKRHLLTFLAELSTTPRFVEKNYVMPYWVAKALSE